MSGSFLARVGVALFALCLCPIFAYPADWTQWRGPFGNGVTDETGWDPAALEDGPQIVWETNLGHGFASVAVKGNRLYAIGNERFDPNDPSVGKDTLYCLDAHTGVEIWQYSYPRLTDSNSSFGPKSSPVIDGDRLYVVSDNTGDIFCFDARNGRIRWKTNVELKFGASLQPSPGWGYAGCPVVAGDLVIFNINSAGLALDKYTGRKKWCSPPGPCSYSTPVVFRWKGKSRLALFGAGKLFILNRRTGSIEGSFPWETINFENSADPLVIGDRVFIASVYNMGCAMLRLTNRNPVMIWRNKDYGNQFSSSVHLNGYIYGIDGHAGHNSLKCLDAKTGIIQWEQKSRMATLIAADNKLIIVTERASSKLSKLPLKNTEKSSAARSN